MTPKEYAANLLAEVKLAEKRLEKARERCEPLADRIRAALRAGDRPAAERLALEYERAKDEVARAEKEVAAAKEAFEEGKRRAARAEESARALKNAQALGSALGAMNAAMDTVSAAEDMLKRLEEEAAVAEAKLDILLEEARDRLPPDDPPSPRAAEDILKEFE